MGCLLSSSTTDSHTRSDRPCWGRRSGGTFVPPGEWCVLNPPVVVRAGLSLASAQVKRSKPRRSNLGEFVVIQQGRRDVRPPLYRDGDVVVILRFLEEVTRLGLLEEVTGPGLSHHEPVSYTHLRAHETRHDLVC